MSPASGLQYGGYTLYETGTQPEVILLGTGSEVHIAIEAGKLLKEKGVASRVVSLPSWELFDAQTPEYRDQVLPPDIRARVSIEAGTPLGWERYVGLDGAVIGLARYGASAPAKLIYEQLGLTAEHITREALKLLRGKKA